MNYFWVPVARFAIWAFDFSRKGVVPPTIVQRLVSFPGIHIGPVISLDVGFKMRASQDPPKQGWVVSHSFYASWTDPFSGVFRGIPFVIFFPFSQKTQPEARKQQWRTGVRAAEVGKF